MKAKIVLDDMEQPFGQPHKFVEHRGTKWVTTLDFDETEGSDDLNRLDAWLDGENES